MNEYEEYEDVPTQNKIVLVVPEGNQKSSRRYTGRTRYGHPEAVWIFSVLFTCKALLFR